MVAQSLVQTLQLSPPFLLQKVRNDGGSPSLLLHQIRPNGHSFGHSAALDCQSLLRLALCFEGPQLSPTLSLNRFGTLLFGERGPNHSHRDNSVWRHQRNGTNDFDLLRTRLGRVSALLLLQPSAHSYRYLRLFGGSESQHESQNGQRSKKILLLKNKIL